MIGNWRCSAILTTTSFACFIIRSALRPTKNKVLTNRLEAEYMDELITAIFESNLIENKKLFQRKYKFVRAIFHLNALHWAANSADPEKNINELIAQRDKKGRNAHMFKISF